MAELLQSHGDIILSYHQHDSLLENQEDQELTEEERKAAWAEFENEKKPQPRQFIYLIIFYIFLIIYFFRSVSTINLVIFSFTEWPNMILLQDVEQRMKVQVCMLYLILYF